jgi:predicted NACHT family NTPase
LSKKNTFLKKKISCNLIVDYLETLQNIDSDAIQCQLDNEAVLKAIEVQNGLLVERERGIYSFSHLTFQ